MCGIMGYIGDENAVEIIISGLEDLEYRGYDSAGIAINTKNDTNIIKCVGSPTNLRNKTQNLYSNIGIGHNRWATHGRADEINAHPHTSRNGLFSIVHNGIIENYKEIKNSLIKDGFEFASETDTEVIAHLLEHHYNGDLKGTVSTVLPMLKGSYAIAILCNDYPDTIVCAKKSSPLFVGTADNSSFVASDISAISDKSDRIFRLNDGEIGMVNKENLRVFDIEGCRIRKTEIKIKKSEKTSDKNGYKHYMLKEIMEQPTAIRNTINEFFDGKKLKFKSIKWSPEELKSIRSVQFIGCGSAYHAGMLGKYICEELFKRNSTAEIASEYRYRHPKIDKNTLVVIISQSGETADTLAALRIAKENNAKIISIVNVENSTIALESENVCLTKAGKEIAVATTKAFTSQLVAIYCLVLFLASVTDELDMTTTDNYLDELKMIPEKIENILNKEYDYNLIADTIINSQYTCFTGRQYDYCSAEEAALKLKEVSYIPCEAYPAGELKHGTISLIDNNSLVIGLCCSDSLREKNLSNLNEVLARGAKTLTLSRVGTECNIQIPKTFDLFYPLLEIIPLQMIAYHTANKKGCEIDKPRNLAKSVTVE